MTRTLLTLVLLVELGACGLSGEDPVDADDANRALEQQRTDVRAAARTLLAGAEKRELSGTIRTSSGSHRGCESTFPDQFRTFQYLAQARIDTGPGSGVSTLTKLGPVLEDAGFTVGDLRGEPNGFTSLAAEKGDLSASFVHTGGPFVGLDVSGPCVEVSRGPARDWLRKDPDSAIH